MRRVGTLLRGSNCRLLNRKDLSLLCKGPVRRRGACQALISSRISYICGGYFTGSRSRLY